MYSSIQIWLEEYSFFANFELASDDHYLAVSVGHHTENEDGLVLSNEFVIRHLDSRSEVMALF